MIVERKTPHSESKTESLQIASEHFDKSRFTFEGEIDEPTLVQISTTNSKNEEISVLNTVMPVGETVSFVLVQLKDFPAAQLYLVGTSIQTTNAHNNFVINGTYESDDDLENGAHF